MIYLRYYNEIADGYSKEEHIAPMVSRSKTKFANLKKVAKLVDGNNEIGSKVLTVVDLGACNSDMKKTLPLLICREAYELHKMKKKERQKHSLHIIVDEAHNILSDTSRKNVMESDHWKDFRLEVFEEIIKEGRKMGVYLTIASQQPRDISETIISQIHNYFIHKLVNERDIAMIRNTVGFLDKLSVDTIPILSTGVCFVTGTGLRVATKVQIDLLEEKHQPNSQNIDLDKLMKKTLPKKHRNQSR